MKSALAAAMACGLLAAAAPAQAEDQRPCVSKREYFSVNGIAPQTRANIEVRWDVAGHGVRLRHFDRRNTYTVRYIACGYDPSEAGVIIQYWKGSGAEKRSKRNVEPGATLHGHR